MEKLLFICKHVLLLQDATTSGFLAVFYLSGGSASASYSSQWSQVPLFCEDSLISLATDTVGVDEDIISCNEEKLAALLGVLAVRVSV